MFIAVLPIYENKEISSRQNRNKVDLQISESIASMNHQKPKVMYLIIFTLCKLQNDICFTTSILNYSKSNSLSKF